MLMASHDYNIVSTGPSSVSVKGRLPKLTYQFTFRDIIADERVRGLMEGYLHICESIVACRDAMSEHCSLPDDLIAVRPASNPADASVFMSVMFDYRHGMSTHHSKPPSLRIPDPTFDIIRRLTLPFTFSSATPQKFQHTLKWIDTNLKVNIEDGCQLLKITPDVTRQVVLHAMRVFSTLIKMNDMHVFTSLTLNASMFLQDRIVELILGRTVASASNGFGSTRLSSSAYISNSIAIDLLSQMPNLSYRDLCLASIFMGTTWTSRPDIQAIFKANPDQSLSDISSQILSRGRNMAIDHIDGMLSSFGRSGRDGVVVILDDNGESVFDLGLIQRLIIDGCNTPLTIVVNQYSVSDNLSLSGLNAIITTPYFRRLADAIQSRRVSVIVENQPFRSYEISYISKELKKAMDDSSFLYIKGANYYETFQPLEYVRYYNFVVHGMTSEILTGAVSGMGICARVPPGSAGYLYNKEHTTPLLSILANKADNRGDQ